MNHTKLVPDNEKLFTGYTFWQAAALNAAFRMWQAADELAERHEYSNEELNDKADVAARRYDHLKSLIDEVVDPGSIIWIVKEIIIS